MFGPLSVMKGRICEMEDLDYFPKGDERSPREEVVSEPQWDEVVIFEDSFVAWLRIPTHPSLAEILLKFQIQLHQLTPNVVVQLLKIFWVVASFGGEPTTEMLAKHYELHYQQKNVQVGEE
jgi:hypothetical protein